MNDVTPCAVLIDGALGSGVLIPGAVYRVAEVREHWEPSGFEGEPPHVSTVVRFDPVPAPAGSAEPLRQALTDLLWWHEWMLREDRFTADLADTDEEADRRHALWNTFTGSHEGMAEWLRGVLSAAPAAGPAIDAERLAEALRREGVVAGIAHRYGKFNDAYYDALAARLGAAGPSVSEEPR